MSDIPECAKTFLSHNSCDKPAVEVIKGLLERGNPEHGERPIPCWFDKNDLRSQGTWMSQLEEAVAACGAAVVFYGPDGHGPVHKYEIDLLLKRAMYERGRDAIRLVLVLLPGAKESSIQGFISLHMWADFRRGLDDAAALQRLRAFILGEAPKSSPGDDPLIPKPEIEPYRGLEAFEGKHASYFFGRDNEIKELCARLNEWPFTTVIGGSGSGKSSVVRAGMQTDLAKKERPTLIHTTKITARPGTNPIRALAEQVAASQSEQTAAERLSFVDNLDTRFRSRPDALLNTLTSLFVRNDQHVLLVIDQFEELFTHSSDNRQAKPSSSGPFTSESQQTQFVELLAAVANSQLDRFRIVITLRADFFDRCLSVPTLKSLIENRTLLLGKLSDEALRTVIEAPALKVGAYFEKGLVARIFKDVENQNGSLPLLQHALKELWEYRRYGFLTDDGYDKTGGVEGALKKRANATLEKLSPTQREIAKNIFLRLTTLGEGVSDSRRRVHKAELYPEKADSQVIDEVLKCLSSQTNRLIVTNDDGTVEVTHEALIQRWDTLKGWLIENRDDKRLHDRLRDAANEWADPKHGRDPSYLWEGGRLDLAEKFDQANPHLLSTIEREFLTACQREHAAELLRLRRRSRIAVGVTLFTLAVSALAGIKWLQEFDAQSNARIADAKADAARKKQYDAELKLNEERILSTEKETKSLRRQLLFPQVQSAPLEFAQQFFQGAAVRWAFVQSRDSQDKFTADLNDTVRRALIPVATSSRRFNAGRTRFSPDGKYLVVGDLPDGIIRLWKVSDLARNNQLGGQVESSIADDYQLKSTFVGHSGDPNGILAAVADFAFNPDDLNEFVSIGPDGIIRVWDISQEKELRHFPEAGAARLSPLISLAIEPGNVTQRRLVIGDDKGGLSWRTLSDLRESRRVQAHTARVRAVAWRPDGAQCASASRDGCVRLWSANGESIADLTVPDASSNPWIYELAFSPDNVHLAAATEDGRILVWETETKTLQWSLTGHENGSANTRAVRSIAWKTADRLISGGADGTLREWDIVAGQQTTIRGRHTPGIIAAAATETVYSLAISPDGRRIAATTFSPSITIWDTEAEQPTFLARLEGLPEGRAGQTELTAIDFRPEHNLLVTAGLARDATIRSFDTRSLRERQTYRIHVPPNIERQIAPTAVAIHPDGKRFLSAERDGELILWDVSSGMRLASTSSAHEPRNLPGFPELSPVATATMVWSSKGDRLVTIGFDSKIKSWKFTDELQIEKEWTANDPGNPQQSPDLFTVMTPDGKTLISAGGDEKVRLWDIETGLITDRLIGHSTISRAGVGRGIATNRLSALTISNNGRFLASGDPDGLIIIWSLNQHKLLRTIPLESLRSDFDPMVRRQPPSEDELFSRQFIDQSRVASKRAVQSIAFSADNGLLAVTLGDGTLRLIETASGKQTHCAVGHEHTQRGGIIGASFSQDGEPVTVGTDGSVRRWNIQPWSAGMRVFDADHDAKRISAAPDGSEWAIVTAAYSLLRKTRAGQSLPGFSDYPRTRISAVAHVSEGVLAGTTDGNLLLFDREAARIKATMKPEPASDPNAFPGDFSNISIIAVHPNGELVATNARAKRIDLWNLRERKWFRSLETSDRIYSLAFSPRDGRRLAAAGESGKLNIWDTATWQQQTKDLPGAKQLDTTPALAWSPDGRRLVQAGLGRQIDVWNVDSGERVQTLVIDGDADTVGTTACIGFSPNGHWLAACGQDMALRLWDTSNVDKYELRDVFPLQTLTDFKANSINGDQLPEINSGGLLHFAFSSDGRELLVGGWNKPIRLFDLAAIEAELTLAPDEVERRVQQLTGLRIRDGRLELIPQNSLLPPLP